MSILTERPPDSVPVHGHSVPVYTDYRAWIRFETLALNGAGARELMATVFPEPPQDAAPALEAALWFYRCGREEEPEEGGEPAYDFEQDAGEIMASFSAAYGVDLGTADMHWWTFRALMQCLPEDTALARLMYIRTADLSDLPDGERRRLGKIRAKFAVKRPKKTLTERDEAWIRAARRAAGG